MSQARTPTWLSAQRRSPYAQLRYDWGDAYEIERTRDGVQARRLDGRGGWITAGGPEELGQKIAADYRARPVSRWTAP